MPSMEGVIDPQLGPGLSSGYPAAPSSRFQPRGGSQTGSMPFSSSTPRATRVGPPPTESLEMQRARLERENRDWRERESARMQEEMESRMQETMERKLASLGAPAPVVGQQRQSYLPQHHGLQPLSSQHFGGP